MVLFDRDAVIRLAAILLLLNIIFVLVLAGTGVLKTARSGDVSTVQSTHLETGKVTLPPTASFIIENPTDVDVFYNIAIHFRHGGSLYPGVGSNPYVQLKYQYAPIFFLVIYPLSFLGYLGFKITWLLLSVFAVILGTYLLIAAESRAQAVEIPTKVILVLSFLAVGFGPIVSNLKTGQTTPFMFLFLALGWWLYRHGGTIGSGAALVGITIIKPYFTAPILAMVNRNNIRPVLGFGIVFLLANGLGVLVFGLDTVISSYEILWNFLAKEQTTPRYGSFDKWSSTHFRPFYWLGSFAPLVRFIFIGALGAVSVVFFMDLVDRPAELLCLSIVSVILFLQTTTAIDLGMLLAVIVIIGVRAYAANQKQTLLLLLISFLFLMAHGYVMELLVGWGQANLKFIKTHEKTVISLLPILQPAIYGVLLLYALSIEPFISDFRGMAQ